MVAGTEEDPVVVGRAGDVEDLDRKRDPFGGEIESRVSTKQGSIAGSEMTLFCWTSNGEGNDNACGRMVRGRIPGYTYKQIGYALYMT